ncbi:hypothetical protein [Streptomyces sp. NPDC001770]
MKPTRAGTAERVSVSMPAQLISELRSRTSRRGPSGHITEAVGGQLAMDGLADIVASHEEGHGALTEQEVEDARRELFGEGSAPPSGKDTA